MLFRSETSEPSDERRPSRATSDKRAELLATSDGESVASINMTRETDMCQVLEGFETPNSWDTVYIFLRFVSFVLEGSATFRTVVYLLSIKCCSFFTVFICLEKFEGGEVLKFEGCCIFYHLGSCLS